LKGKNARFPTERRKVVTYYSVSSTRRPEGAALKVHRSPALCTVLDRWRVSMSLSKRENVRSPTEGRKAVTCYSVDGTRRPASPKCTEAQHFPPHWPAGESISPYLRAGTLTPPLSGSPLLCSCQETCFPRYAEVQHSPLCLTAREPPHTPIKKQEHRIPH
jgi:hypothetical protein